MMKRNLTFVWKCILVIIPIILVSIYSKNNLMAFADQEAPYYIWNKQFCNTTQPKKYDVIILGDSIANAAYMPEVLSDSTVNLSLGGTTPVENYYTMQDWLEHNPAPKSVYISFMDSHMNTTNSFWLRTMYTHRYTPVQNWSMLKMAKEYDEACIATENCNLDFLAYELYLPNKYITSFRNAGFNQRYKANISEYYANDLHKGRYISRRSKEWAGKASKHSHFKVAPLFDEYYKKLIELCLENNIKVHLIKLPLPSSITFTQNFIEEFNSYYNSIQTLYPDVMIDWFKDGYDNHYFMDSRHANTHGALRFSTELKQLYPDEFSSDLSYEQIEAINDNISNENLLEEMFKWGELGSYTFIIYDGVGTFTDLYQNSFQQGGLVCSKYHAYKDKKSAVYVVDTFDVPSSFEQIYQSDNKLEIRLRGNTKYSWNPFNLYGLNVIAIDNYNSQVVCEKQFAYTENTYTLLK